MSNISFFSSQTFLLLKDLQFALWAEEELQAGRPHNPPHAPLLPCPQASDKNKNIKIMEENQKWKLNGMGRNQTLCTPEKRFFILQKHLQKKHTKKIVFDILFRQQKEIQSLVLFQ